MSSYKIPVFLDCDPGHDDAIAIIVAAHHPKFNLVGVSTVHGNASLEKTTNNALAVLTAIGKADEIPVYPGADRPLVREPSYAPSIHGESGLEGSSLLPKPSVKAREKGSAVDAMYEAATKYPGELAIVATGTFTNVAMLLQKYPDVKSKVKCFSFMGGGIEESNWGAGEFNLWCDPHAANVIVEDPEISSKCYFAPIDLTHKLIATKEIEQKILNEPHTSKIRQMIYELILFFKKAYIEEQGFESGPPVHDPLAVIALLQVYGIEDLDKPLEYKFNQLKIHVVEDGELNGKIEVLDKNDKKNGVNMGYDLNIPNFWKVVLDSIAVAEKYSPIENN